MGVPSLRGPRKLTRELRTGGAMPRRTARAARRKKGNRPLHLASIPAFRQLQRRVAATDPSKIGTPGFRGELSSLLPHFLGRLVVLVDQVQDESAPVTARAKALRRLKKAAAAVAPIGATRKMTIDDAALRLPLIERMWNEFFALMTYLAEGRPLDSESAAEAVRFIQEAMGSDAAATRQVEETARQVGETASLLLNNPFLASRLHMATMWNRIAQIRRPNRGKKGFAATILRLLYRVNERTANRLIGQVEALGRRRKKKALRETGEPSAPAGEEEVVL
jgi:hypothetical protein